MQKPAKPTSITGRRLQELEQRLVQLRARQAQLQAELAYWQARSSHLSQRVAQFWRTHVGMDVDRDDTSTASAQPQRDTA